MPKLKFWKKSKKDKEKNRGRSAEEEESAEYEEKTDDTSGKGRKGKKGDKYASQNGSSDGDKRKKGRFTISRKEGKSKKRVLIEVETAHEALKPAREYTREDVLRYELPLIRATQDLEKKRNIVIRKLRLCCVTFDFDEEQQTDMDLKGIERKRQMLVEIVEYISSQTWWNEELLVELLQCIRFNLFRPLPTSASRRNQKGDEEEEPFQDPQWLHLQLVYELCLRFLIANDIDKKVMQSHLHGSFILCLIKLFESEDTRERDYLKTILHRIYGRFMPLRQQIRDEIANECYKHVYGSDRTANGLAEFLDIFSSIINGFSIPVKPEHQAFLRNVLLPLHKCPNYDMYFQQLADCCVLFVNKDQSIAPVIIGGLLKFWPHTSPTKQAFFLRELLSVVGALVEHEQGFDYAPYAEIVMAAINKMLDCINSDHFQVADTALTLWKDTVMIYLSKANKDYIWRRLFAALKQNMKSHWNEGIVTLAEEIADFYKAADIDYWKHMEEEYKNLVELPQTPQSPDGGSELPTATPQLTSQVSLVRRIDLDVAKEKRERKDRRRAARWALVRKLADDTN